MYYASGGVAEPHERSQFFPVVLRRHSDSMYAKGGLAQEARAARDAGRHGDTELVHVNREELAKMREMWGDPTINPETGMPEFFIGKLLKTVLPIAVSFIPGVGPIAGAALRAGAGAAAGALDGGGLKGALVGATGGALGAPGVGDKLGSVVGNTLGNSSLAKDVGKAVVNAAPAVVDTALTRSPLPPPPVIERPLLTVPDMSVAPEAMRAYDQNPVPISAVPDEVRVRAPSASPEMKRLPPDLLAAYYDSLGMRPMQRGKYADGGLAQGIMPVDYSADWRKALGLQPAAQNIVAGDQPRYPRQPGLPQPEENWFSRNSIIKGIPNGLLVGGALSLLPLLFRKKDDDDDGVSIPDRIRTFQQRGYAMGGYAEGGEPQDRASFTVSGPGDGRSDDIPAQLSDGEYVFDAETVALLGNGSTKAGAKRLDDFRVNIRKHKGRKLARGKFSHDAKPPERYMRGGAY